MQNQRHFNLGNSSHPLNEIEQIHRHISAASDFITSPDRIHASIMIQGVCNGQEYHHLLSWKGDQIPGELLQFFQAYGDRLYSQKLLINPDGSLQIDLQTANHE